MTRTIHWLYAGMLLWGASPASGGLVSVSGVFTQYNGPLGGCGQYTSFINGQNVTPATGCDPATLLKQVSMALPSPSSVEFWERQFFETTDAVHNLISFTPASPQNVTSIGQEFLLGQVTFGNGIWFGQTSVRSPLPRWIRSSMRTP